MKIPDDIFLRFEANEGTRRIQRNCKEEDNQEVQEFKVQEICLRTQFLPKLGLKPAANSGPKSVISSPKIVLRWAKFMSNMGSTQVQKWPQTGPKGAQPGPKQSPDHAPNWAHTRPSHRLRQTLFGSPAKGFRHLL